VRNLDGECPAFRGRPRKERSGRGASIETQKTGAGLHSRLLMSCSGGSRGRGGTCLAFITHISSSIRVYDSMSAAVVPELQWSSLFPIPSSQSVSRGHSCPLRPWARHISVSQANSPINWLSSLLLLSVLAYCLTRYVLAKLPRA
jgi:hypothetical protein